MLPLEKLFLVIKCAVRPDVYPQPIAGATVGLVHIVIFPSPWGWSDFEVVLALVRAAYTLLSLWHCFGIAPAKDIWEGSGLQEKVGAACTI